MILTKENDYIVDRDDHYSISILNINDSLQVELDKRLHVEGDAFIAGDLSCKDLVVDGTLVVNGNVSANSIQANEIYLMRNSSIEDNLVGRANIQIGRSIVKGSIISNGNLLAVSDITVLGNTSVAVTFIAKGKAKFSGSLAVGALLDAHYSFECNSEVKIAGILVTEYGRISDGKYVYVITDTIMSIGVSNGAADIFENINTKIEELTSGCIQPTDREKFILDNYKWIRNIASSIKKEEQ